MTVWTPVYLQATCTSVLRFITVPILFLTIHWYRPASVLFRDGTDNLKEEETHKWHAAYGLLHICTYICIYIYIWAINKHYHSFCWMLTNISLDWSNVFSLWFSLPTCNPAKWLISHQQMKPKHIMHNINSNRINSNSLWVKHIIQNDTIRRKRCTSLVLSHDTCHGENQK